MKIKLTKDQVFGIIRHTMTFVGGILLAKGLVDEGFMAEVSGAILTLVGSIWSVVEKNK